MSRALGRYELLRPLARGGMAEVYLARRRAAGIEKWLVVKRIRPERSGDVRFLDLFVREARLSMSLVHQNIVPVFDFGRIDDQVFLAMERVEGKDLGSTLARAAGRRVSPVIAAFIAAECCQALDYAHHRKSPEGALLGIVHRDVTPRNVLLSWSGEVKLTDFGIATLAGESTARLLGTPAYMAPEQARSEALDVRADVYAVGLLLREMLTGERARPGTERDHLLEAARTGALVPWPADLATPLIAIVDRATSLRPDDRFPDARSMLAELDSVIVTERAARKSEAPARLLTSWLDDIWAGDRDDSGSDQAIEGNHLVSFLDDGALDVIGTGTERSLLATAADEPATPTPPAPPPEAAAPADLPSPSASSPASITKPEVPARRIGLLAVVLIVIAAAGLGAIAMRVLRDDGPGASQGPQVAEVTPPAVTGPATTAVPSLTEQPAPVPPDAAPAAPPTTQTVDGRVRPTTGQNRPTSGHNRPTSGQPRQGSAAPAPSAGSAAAAVALRKVTINATPWAYFTIDGGSTQHETVKTVLLSPGPHRIHFTNPVLKVERDVTIEVPADRDLQYVERLGN